MRRINGINNIRDNCHQPDLLMSCNLLAPTAKLGNKIARVTNNSSNPIPIKIAVLPITVSIPHAMMVIIDSKRKNHQNSARVALALKSKYFLKHVWTASMKLTRGSSTPTVAPADNKLAPQSPQNWAVDEFSSPQL